MRRIDNRSFWIGNMLMVLLVVLLFGCRGFFIIDDSNYLQYRDLRKIEFLKQLVDSAEIKYYIDKKYNVKIFYPDFMNIADTSKAGAAHFKSSYSDMSFELSVDTNLFKSNVEKAVNYLVYITDSATTCLDKGENSYLAKGKSFLQKGFLMDNNWIEYKMSYNKNHEEIIGWLINLMKQWEPREDHKK